MIHLFRDRKTREQSEALQTVVRWFDERLIRFAIYLSRKTEHLPPRRTAAFIIASCFFFSVCLGFSVFKTTKDSRQIHVSAIRAPLVRMHQSTPVNEIVLERIRHFDHQLDSLRQNDVLRYDSLMKSRPRLQDSMITAEHMLSE